MLLIVKLKSKSVANFDATRNQGFFAVATDDWRHSVSTPNWLVD
jgi:hypothetical protein